MLYQAAQAALSKLIQDSGVQAGAACLVFDVASNTVTHVSFVNDPGLQLGKAEFLVHVDVPESKSAELAVKAAAINAVNDLSQLTQISDQDRGVRGMKGLMFSVAGGHLRLLPYSESALGFTHKGSTIGNPMLSPNQSYEVDPVKAYGFRVASGEHEGRVLERDHEDGGRLRISVADNGFVIDRFDENNKKIAYVFSGDLPDSERGAWMNRLPGDFLSHRDAWRRGLERLIELEPESGRPDSDDKGYWRQELRAFDFAYGELDSLRGVQLQRDDSWEQRLPHDFLSHRNAWRQAFERLIELEPESGLPDQDEKGFWKHELCALDLAYQQLDQILADQQLDGVVWVNPGPVVPLQTGPQSAQIEAKVAGLQAQASEEHDPDAYAEISRFGDAIVGLEKITNQISRDNSAYALARKHLVQYYGFDGTSLEQDMLQVILDGMDASPVYRRAVEEESTDSMELALQAAVVVRDRATLAKEERKELDMQHLSPGFP